MMAKIRTRVKVTIVALALAACLFSLSPFFAYPPISSFGPRREIGRTDRHWPGPIETTVLEDLECHGWRVEHKVVLNPLPGTLMHLHLVPPFSEHERVYISYYDPALTEFLADCFCCLDPTSSSVWSAIASLEGGEEFTFGASPVEGTMTVEGRGRVVTIRVSHQSSKNSLAGRYEIVEGWP
jgi:hypothetical protein